MKLPTHHHSVWPPSAIETPTHFRTRQPYRQSKTFTGQTEPRTRKSTLCRKSGLFSPGHSVSGKRALPPGHFPCEFQIPFCEAALAVQCLAFPNRPALAVTLLPFSAKRNGGGFFRYGVGCRVVQNPCSVTNSRHSGLKALINASFASRFMFFIWFSLRMADG